MINKNIKKIFTPNQFNSIRDLNLKCRPSNLKPEIYYEITALYEKYL